MCLLVFIFALGFCAKASAATYYVSKTTANGYAIGIDNTISGQGQSKSKPWLTPSYAITTASNGDTIIINDGTYSGTELGASSYLRMDNKLINIQAENSKQVTFLGTVSTAVVRTVDPLAGQSATFTGLILDANSIANYVLWDYETAGNLHTINFVNCDLKNAVFYGIDLDPATKIILNTTNTNYSGVKRHFIDAVKLVSPSAISVTGGTTTLTGYENTSAVINLKATGTGVSATISGHTLDITLAAGQTGGNFDGIGLANISTSIVQNNYVYLQNHSGVWTGAGIRVTADTSIGVSATVSGNHIYNYSTGGYGIIVGSDSSTAGNNQVNNPQIYNNYITCTPANQTSAIHGIIVGFNQGGNIYNNNIGGCGLSLIAKDNSTTPAVFHNNIMTDVYSQGMYAKGSAGTQFLNNTIYTGTVAGVSPNAYILLAQDDSATGTHSTGVVFKNNNLYYNAMGLSKFALVDTNNTATFSNNSYYSTQALPAGVFSYQGTGYNTLVLWKAAGFDSSSQYADPKFVNAPTDLSLQNTSPAINAGINSIWTGTNNIVDYIGNLITNGSGVVVASGGTVDMGAYEFQDSTAPTTTTDIDTGTYNATQTVHLTCNDGAGVGCDKTYYTLTGVDPTTSSTVYTTAISIPDNATTILKFFSVDRSNNTETPIKSKTYIIDTIAPETTIDSNPNASINTNSATFTFSANETSTFQCKLDSGVYATCTTPKNYASLSEGSHTFYVKATDTATNEDATPASYTFTVDTLIPTISDLVPNNTTLSATTTSTNLTLTTSEITTCKYSATSGTDYASMTAFNSTNNTTHSTVISSLNPGTTYDYYIICKDVINESAEEHLTFSVAPEENKISLSAVKIKINRQFNKFKDTIQLTKNKFKLKSQDDNLANGTVKIYKGNSLWKTVSIDADGAWNKTLKLANDTTKTIKLKFYDALGTLFGTKKAKIKVDTEDPKFNEAIPEKMTIGRNQKIQFTAADDNSGIDYYKVKLADIRDWRQQNEDFYQIPQDIPNGTHDLFIRAYDKAGNYVEEKTTLNVSQYRNSISLASASLNPYNTSERNTLNTENKIQNNTNTAPNNSSSNNSPLPQTQSQPSPPVGGFKWYNPSTWF